MDILLVSHRDSCRSRIAQALLLAFGKGIKVFTCGTDPSDGVSGIAKDLMAGNGYEISMKPGLPIEALSPRKWGYLITLCPEAEAAANSLEITAEYRIPLDFPDPGTDPQATEALYGQLYHDLFRLWKDEIQDHLMPSCTCGANTYCRCE